MLISGGSGTALPQTCAIPPRTGLRSARGELLAAAKIARELFDPRLSRVLSDAIIIAVLAAGLTLLAASSPSGRRSMALLLIPACYLALGCVVMPSVNDNGPGSEGPPRITLTCGPVAVIASVAVIMAVRYVRRHDAAEWEVTVVTFTGVRLLLLRGL